MIQGCQNLRFALEASHAVSILRKVFWQNFKRNLAAELRICGSVHFAHAALAELGGDLIVCDGLADHFLSPASQFTSRVKGGADIKPLATLSNKKRFPSAVT